jgi:ABC-type branched-subunit amino acid transport system ATPase component/ABC-type branched-subunit amino acid transport system permease subunit
LVLLAVACALPALTTSQSYRLGQYEYILALVVLSASLNITTGFAGQLALGQSAVFAVSGYGVVVVANHFPAQTGLLLMILIGCAFGALTGIVIGLPSLRVGGFYLAMITLFAALVVPTVAGQLSLTGGSSGISLLANLDFNRYLNGWFLYEVFVGIVASVVVASWAILHSRVGRRFTTLKSSEELASSVGVAPYKTKLLAFLLGSIIAGIAGAMYVYSQQFMSPESSTTTTSIYLLAACIVGGLGTVMGPIVGGLLVFGLNQFLGGLAEDQGIIFGVLLMLFVILVPGGFVGFAGGLVGRLLPKSKQSISTGTGAPADVLSIRTENVRRSPSFGGDPTASLTVTGATRAFGGVVAVDDVSLVVRPGTVHGLVGSNGSGKTTMLNLISGYYPLDGGQVHLGDRRIDGKATHQIARLGIARTFQTPKLVGETTVVENLLPAIDTTMRRLDLASLLRLPAGRRSEKAARATAIDALDAMGIAEWQGHRADELPHGTRRLVEVARALLLRPTFVLLDEPAAGLGLVELDQLSAAIRRMADEGVGVLLIEHNIPFVLALATEVTVLHQGKRHAGGPPSILYDQAVSSVFLGEDPQALQVSRP